MPLMRTLYPLAILAAGLLTLGGCEKDQVAGGVKSAAGDPRGAIKAAKD